MTNSQSPPVPFTRQELAVIAQMANEFAISGSLPQAQQLVQALHILESIRNKAASLINSLPTHETEV